MLIPPGQIALQRILSLRYVKAVVFVRPITACFAIVYAQPLLPPQIPAMEATFTMLPPLPLSRKSCTALRVAQAGPKTSTFIRRSIRSVSRFSTGAKLSIRPALLIRMSILPNFSTAKSIIFVFVSSREISPAYATISPASSLDCSSSAASLSARLATATTFAPSFAKRSAISLPTPLDAPVTTATLFSSFIFCSSKNIF